MNKSTSLYLLDTISFIISEIVNKKMVHKILNDTKKINCFRQYLNYEMMKTDIYIFQQIFHNFIYIL